MAGQLRRYLRLAMMAGGDEEERKVGTLQEALRVAPGVYAVAFKPVSKTKDYIVNLRSVTLRRVGTKQE